ncbi:MAG: hypothetical protein ACFFDK_03750 [Promethearchaeota archaeon]
MEKRNFNILVAATIIGIVAFWLTAYNVAALGIDYLEYVRKNTASIIFGEEDDNEDVITFTGKVKYEFKLSLDDLKSDKYRQITRSFEFKNRYGTKWNETYTGATLWSILIAEDILASDAKGFLFIGEDGYSSPEPISINDIDSKDSEVKVILAYLEDGDPLFSDGPVRSIVDRSVVQDLEPDHYNSQFAVKNLKYVEIT